MYNGKQFLWDVFGLVMLILFSFLASLLLDNTLIPLQKYSIKIIKESHWILKVIICGIGIVAVRRSFSELYTGIYLAHFNRGFEGRVKWFKIILIIIVFLFFVSLSLRELWAFPGTGFWEKTLTISVTAIISFIYIFISLQAVVSFGINREGKYNSYF